MKTLLNIAALLCFVLAARAQTNSTPPVSDPILRYVPLERERVHPDPDRNLVVQPQPGTQTVILQEYRPTLPTDQLIPAVVLYIPDKLFSRTTNRPAEVWGINFVLQYPEMEPVNWAVRRCSAAWCGNEITMHLEISRKPIAQRQTDRNSHLIGTLSDRKDPLVTVTEQTPPPDYSEAYIQLYPAMRPPRTEQIYIKRDGNGVPREYVTCAPHAPNPQCKFDFELEGTSTLQISYSVSMRLWNSRDDVRRAVVDLVNSFNPRLLRERR